MQTIIRFLACYLIFQSISYAGDNNLFDLKAVANKSPALVETILGKPSEVTDGTFKGKQVKRGKYKNEIVEITFIDDGARYITILLNKETKNNPYNYPSSSWPILKELGLDANATAEISNSFVTRFKSGNPGWNHFPGIYEISIFPDGNKAGYIHVLTDKKYE